MWCLINLNINKNLEGGIIMNFIASLLAKIGGMTADMGTVSCPILVVDEPQAPKALIEK